MNALLSRLQSLPKPSYQTEAISLFLCYTTSLVGIEDMRRLLCNHLKVLRNFM